MDNDLGTEGVFIYVGQIYISLTSSLIWRCVFNTDKLLYHILSTLSHHDSSQCKEKIKNKNKKETKQSPNAKHVPYFPTIPAFLVLLVCIDRRINHDENSTWWHQQSEKEKIKSHCNTENSFSTN